MFVYKPWYASLKFRLDISDRTITADTTNFTIGFIDLLIFLNYTYAYCYYIFYCWCFEIICLLIYFNLYRVLLTEIYFFQNNLLAGPVLLI